MIHLLAVVLAYLIGSFPSGVVVVRMGRGFDIRQVGSRRSGMTNVLRGAGVVSAVVVFLLDVIKGAGAVWVGRWLMHSTWVGNHVLAWTGRPAGWPLPSVAQIPTYTELACGLAAIVGHNWPIYVRFRGGRGVNTTFGTLIALAPYVAAGAFLGGAIVIASTRYVSLGSVIGACLVPVGLFLQAILGSLPIPVFLYGLLTAGTIVFQHRDNIARLRAGTERRLGEQAKTPPAERSGPGQPEQEPQRHQSGPDGPQARRDTRE